MELPAGATLTEDRRAIQRIVSTFAGARRILVPSATVFAEAEDVRRQLRMKRGFNIGNTRSIVNDVLIALSARSIGASITRTIWRRALRH